jgi:MEMO1 family protein
MRNEPEILPASVAGRFYPSEPGELRRMVEGFLAAAKTATGSSPKAIIAPHAGYVFSGPVAGSAYAQLIPDRNLIRRIILLGPSHYHSFEGLVTTGAMGFATPLGIVPVDAAAREGLAGLPQVRMHTPAFLNEHALEVQLPFLQVALEDFTVLPLAAGDVSAEQVSEVIEALWGGPETRFVVSSDLSHFLSWHSARRLDAETARAIESLEPGKVSEGQACGHAPVRGLLNAARRRGLHARTLDLRNSGDTAGPRDRVVGYGAFAFD